jgi:hypothetical protein
MPDPIGVCAIFIQHLIHFIRENCAISGKFFSQFGDKYRLVSTAQNGTFEQN